MTSTDQPTEHLDVAVIGAGISGIGAAHYLRERHPDRSVAVLEARGSIGGTWDLFRYPGTRSDSDLHTFGFEFAPWTERESIASGASILEYLHRVAEEDGLSGALRLHSRVVGAEWSTASGRWRLEVEDPRSGERASVTANWLFCATGYYRYDRGHCPDFPGIEEFSGPVVHPQHWPEDLDHAEKHVLVIGSGATAMTLVPALADEAAHVTMLQRTPTYVVPVPRVDPVASLLRRVLGEERSHGLVRRKNIWQAAAVWRFCQRHPEAARAVIRWLNARELPPGYPVDVHFRPPYRPWDQRLCVVPDGDFFAAIRERRASVVTDRVERFTPDGVQLRSGRHLRADVVVTATGLSLQLLGGMDLSVDGRRVDLSDTMVHRGTMLTGVPNLSIAIGYTNSSWTLKIGLLCEYVCDLLSAMDEAGADVALVERAAGLRTRPLFDFGAGYVQRSLDELPAQGPHAPWQMSQSYHEDLALLRTGGVLDEHVVLSRSAKREAVAAPTVGAA